MYQERARLSEGQSVHAVHRMIAGAMKARRLSNVVLADVGCGRGDLRAFVGARCSRYIGVDAVRYEGFPHGAEFVSADLNDPDTLALPGGQADVVASLETIEHLENPRAFMRLLNRLTRPGGWISSRRPTSAAFSAWPR